MSDEGGDRDGDLSSPSVTPSHRQGQEVKDLRTIPPRVGVPILALTLVVEAVDLRDLPRLVVAAEDGDAVTVPDLERDEQRRRLDRVVAAVDVVAHEQVVRVRRGPADAEQLEEVLGWSGGGRRERGSTKREGT